jgi:23S rRNA (adenine2503-C2)-methyltransferase
MDAPQNLFDLTRDGLRAYFTALGERPYRAAQIMKWLYHRGVTDVGAMTDLSRELRETLAPRVSFDLPEVALEQVSTDGTRKWLLRVDEANSVEAVFIPEADRGTLCISSQVGCPLDCSFCSTGKQGFNRNLTTAQIIGQLWFVNRALGCFDQGSRMVSNVVMMGMGEPLLNFDNVVPALELIMDDLAFGLAHRRVTVSTAGVVPGIDRLARTLRVALAVSLHAPTDTLRDELVPINRRYPIAELLAACRRYADATGGDPITFEYVMLDGVNDGPAEARELARLLRGLPAKVNLIPFNPFPGSGYTRSPLSAINRFRDLLMQAGLIAITRRTRGEDIDAACGQLVGRVVPKAARLRAAAEARA